MPVRHGLQVRITTRHDAAGAQGLWGPTTAEQRLQLLHEASALAWELTGRPTPTYGRAHMPVRVVRRPPAGEAATAADGG